MATRYRANAPRFVDETVDGEALIIDMVKGTYFSATGADRVGMGGAFPWCQCRRDRDTAVGRLWH